ncbi:MAG: SDR family oxidoreductase [Spirochaetota bacterium]
MKQQTAWVTGGGTGIGLGIARALADDGYAVYISGRREEVLDKAVAAYDGAARAGAGSLTAARADVSRESDIDAVVKQIVDSHSRIDVAVISSGINVANRSLEDTTPDEWRRILDVNATGSFLVMRAVVPSMKSAGGGLIVNVSSIAGLRALAMAGVAYSASKFASRALGIFAGNELARAGIRVTNIYPGEVSTPILDQRAAPPSAERRAEMAQPEDVGKLVSLIAAFPSTTEVSEVVIKPRYQGLV